MGLQFNNLPDYYEEPIYVDMVIVRMEH